MLDHQRNLDLRPGLSESIQDRHQQVARSGGDAHREVVGADNAKITEGGLELFGIRQHASGGSVDLLASLGGDHLPTRPYQQLGTQLPLQLADLEMDGGLLDHEQIRGSSEGLMLDHQAEQPQAVQVHIQPL
jgi:hypothetical protein